MRYDQLVCNITTPAYLNLTPQEITLSEYFIESIQEDTHGTTRKSWYGCVFHGIGPKEHPPKTF